MKVIRAEHLGMCFGVRDAIALAFQHSQQQPLTILGDLVHNQTVVANLRARGVQIVDAAAAVKTESVMITAHGASDKTIASVKERGLSVLEATCPLVRVAHRAVKNLVAEAYHPVVIGVRGHVERPLARVRIRAILYPAVIFALLDGAGFVQHGNRPATKSPNRRSVCLRQHRDHSCQDES